MSGSRKISELVTATALAGDEIVPLVQQGETRQVAVSLLSAFAPVLAVNGQTGLVVIQLGDLAGEDIIRNGIVSSTIVSVNTVTDDLALAITSVQTFLVNETGAVSVRVDDVSAALTSVQTFLLAQVSVATSGGITEAPTDGLLYGRRSGSWSSVILPYGLSYDFGASVVPADEYAKIVVDRNIYFLPDFAGSFVDIGTSAFPSTIVSVPILAPTSTTLGVLTIDVSGTVGWPAIVTTSVAPGQTVGIQTPAASDATLKGLSITLVGQYRV